MYLRKNGCEWYKVLFHNINLIIENKKRERNDGVNTDMLRRVGEYDVLDVLNELNGHIKNIIAHIKSEDNVIKDFIEKVNAHIGKITDPKTAKLFRIIQILESIENNFAHLEEDVNISISIFANPTKSEANLLVQRYIDIESRLRTIYDSSRVMARDLKEVIAELHKEEEMIKKEEEVMTDFNKNMMSWF